jgi:3-deoxy-D-arabino-heptulosonate 7-phosphate (DAHP) synthase
MTGNDFYSREFFSGQLSISRGELESLPCPFCTKNVTDGQMQAIIDGICANTRVRMRLSADKKIDMSCDKTSSVWWEELEHTVVAAGIPYYEDMDKQ